jgi:phosphodiesterase/alkaline phosphatase D-like protein
LQPGRPYWFRFIAGGEASAIGRTRTAPAPGTMADRLRFCFGSCPKYEDGEFGAWANAVAEDPDLIVSSATISTRKIPSWARRGSTSTPPLPLVIGGDTHAFVASEIRFRDRPLAPCFVGGTILTTASDMLLQRDTADLPAYRFARNDVRGYGRIDVTPAQCEVTFRALRNPLDPRTAAYDPTRYVVENRTPTMQVA